MWDEIGPGDITFNLNMTRDSLKEYIKSLNKDIFIKVSEDLEKEETTLDMIPFNGSSTFTPLTFKMLLTDEEKLLIANRNEYAKKIKSKKEAKKLVPNKYKVGDILILRGKIKDGSKRLEKIFEVKKIIWSIKSNPINVLILKQLSGVNNNRSLTKFDCKKYHIKYEPGLQVYSMLTSFSKRKKLN